MKYRRFISYLYGENEENIHRNAGFVRVEARGIRGRLQVLVRDADRKSGCVSAAIIGLPAGPEGRESVLLGQMRLCAGCGERTLTLRTEPGAGDRVSLDELAGIIVLPDDGSRRLMAIWGAIEKKRAPEPVQKEILEPQEMPGPERPEKALKSEEAPERGELSGFEAGPAPEEQRGCEKTEETFKPEEASGQSEMPEPEEMPEPKEVPEPEEGLEPEDVTEPKEVPKPEESEEPEVHPEPGRFRREEILHAMQMSDERQAGRDEYTISWRTLSLTCPHILPFGRESEWEVLRICVQDIGRLPRKNWVLGANRFLLQNYEEYGHLILAKSPHGGVFIGVPGEAPAGESRMAKLFGFHEYKTAGRRGYWLSGIEL